MKSHGNLISLSCMLAVLASCFSTVRNEPQGPHLAAWDSGNPVNLPALMRAAVEAPTERSDRAAGAARTTAPTKRLAKNSQASNSQDPKGSSLLLIERDFYRQRGYRPAWSDERGPSGDTGALLEAIDRAAAEGLDLRSAALDLRAQRAALAADCRHRGALADPRVAQRLVDLDLAFTRTFLLLARATAGGRVDPTALADDWYDRPKPVDPGALLTQALGKAGVATALAAAEPSQPAFSRLRAAYQHYGEIAARGGWPEIPAGPKLSRGATGQGGERVRLVKARLVAEGYLAPDSGAASPSTPPLYDAPLAEAVALFQSHHGLDPNGAVDEATRAALNVPAAERQRQIALNLERWRWLPADFGDRYLVVNLPQCELALLDQGRTVLTMRVVVGKPKTRTPILSDRVTGIELNPDWNLPDSIVQNEIAPAVLRDPQYLSRKNLEVYEGWKAKASPVDPSQVDWARLTQG
ncbi:MAG TPA: L,D-transpeptidase family protein, partial [Thermoanaerobaculia bacterium]|nr:L,D-transpeptidase family protein [Thermoanaerobaculia bacterium]